MGPVDPFRVNPTRDPNREGEFMRKLLVAVIAAAALFAVGAFAASFAVNSEDIASGSDAVTACAATVDVDFTTVYDEAGDWNVASAVVKFYDAEGNPTDGCEGFGINLAVGTESDSSAATGEATVVTDQTSVTVPLSPAVKASAITSAAVLADGEALVLPTPGGGF